MDYTLAVVALWNANELVLPVLGPVISQQQHPRKAHSTAAGGGEGDKYFTPRANTRTREREAREHRICKPPVYAGRCGGEAFPVPGGGTGKYVKLQPSGSAVRCGRTAASVEKTVEDKTLPALGWLES